MKVYLFDWGDTLMVDFPHFKGKMCLWPEIEVVSGAHHTLATLSRQHSIYIATGADDSTEHEIKSAFERAGLDPYIQGYLCKSNLGVGKSSPYFFSTILSFLLMKASNIIMVGDNIQKDIVPALEEGLEAIWFNPQSLPLPTLAKNLSFDQVTVLTDLLLIDTPSKES